MGRQRYPEAKTLVTRYTEPEPELRLLIDRMKLELPAQPPPKIAAATLKAQPAL
jgi:hypothetical protein